MSVSVRLANEKRFHDRQADERAKTFARHPSRLRFDSETYLDHETWIRPAVRKLGDLRELSVLDYGCGHGMAAVVFARMGAQVTAFDLSSGYLREGAARARANAALVNFAQADAEHLPFASESFDRIWGNAILHHLDIRQAGRELFRVMRPGGIAVFCEPWGANPLLNWARANWRRQADRRTPDERPLELADVDTLRDLFRSVNIEGFQLLAALRSIWKNGRKILPLDAIDHFLLDRVPSLQRYCRYVVVTLMR
jgi:SAM-dependent methyltransferase